jgi:hypothetical protein
VNRPEPGINQTIASLFLVFPQKSLGKVGFFSLPAAVGSNPK